MQIVYNLINNNSIEFIVIESDIKYVVWHDNDYDLAFWVIENSSLKNFKNIIIKTIPKNKSELKDYNDLSIFPYIKFATPDLLIQKIQNNIPKIVFATEFMTHTSQHDHVFQRFERIYCIVKEKIPIAFVFPYRKTKFERGNKDEYTARTYKASPMPMHTYIKTNQINQTPALVYFWPQDNGYLLYDHKHATSPKVSGQIHEWIKFLDEALRIDNGFKLFKTEIVQKQIKYLEEEFKLKDRLFTEIKFDDYIQNISSYYKQQRAELILTSEAIRKFKLDINKLDNSFINNHFTLIYKYNSKTFRTDPYCGYVCAYEILFCRNENNTKKNNLIMIPENIVYNNSGLVNKNESLEECPIHSSDNFKKFSFSEIKKHIDDKCVYTLSKQERIFGTIPDIILFQDFILYNKNK